MNAAPTQPGEAEDVAVRAATGADTEFVSQENYLANVGGPRTIRRLLERGQVLVAEQDAIPVGYAFLDYLCVIDPFLASVRVAPAHRRRGVGTALLLALEDRLRGEGYALLYSSARADAAGAQVWHRRVGFEECGFLTGHGPGGVGELFFRKALREPGT